jgi:hypothetical protein
MEPAMRMMKATLCFLTAAALCLFLGPAAHAQGPMVPDSTHYWTWSLVDPIFIPDQPEARDQFIQQYRILFNLRLHRLLNPVTKYHASGVATPIRDSTLHYTWYEVQPPFPANQTVEIHDQFYPNGFTTRVDTLGFMLVPARKDTLQPPQQPTPPPGAANHYLCWRIEAPSPNTYVGLEDQFRRDPQVFVYEAEWLCNPCWKRHLGVEYPPRDETHLILYRIVDPYQNKFPYLHDQFVNGRFLVHQTEREYLLVPATKKEVITPTQQSSWGRLKALYR